MIKIYNIMGQLDKFGTSIPEKDSNKLEIQSNPPPAPVPESSDSLKISKEYKWYTQWTKSGSTDYTAVSKTFTQLPSGMYTVFQDSYNNIHFNKRDIKIDDLLKFPDSVSGKVLEEIKFFWKRHSYFEKFGFLHRRGYLFYGPAGSGKTILIQQIISEIINQDGIVFICGNPRILNSALSVYRQVEPDKKVVCVFEDIDAIIDQYSESDLLSLLDGENQIDNCLNIASTNYPEKLDPRIVARPRRFDRVIEIDMPSDSIRRVYFHNKLKIETTELDKWVKATDGFSFAACAELVISVKCLNNSFEESVNILRELMVNKPNSSDFKKEKLGFGFKK